MCQSIGFVGSWICLPWLLQLEFFSPPGLFRGALDACSLPSQVLSVQPFALLCPSAPLLLLIKYSSANLSVCSTSSLNLHRVRCSLSFLYCLSLFPQFLTYLNFYSLLPHPCIAVLGLTELLLPHSGAPNITPFIPGTHNDHSHHKLLSLTPELSAQKPQKVCSSGRPAPPLLLLSHSCLKTASPVPLCPQPLALHTHTHTPW